MTKKNNAFLPAALSAGLAAGMARRKSEDGVRKGAPAPVLEPDQELVRRMPELICCDRFRLVVQPVIDLQTGDIVGGEILSRLDHPEQGVIFPDKFLPAVENAGLYLKFDHHIFAKSCALLKRLTEQGVRLQYLSCNFSRMTLSEKGTATRLAAIADKYGVAHDRLAVEVTEREPEGDSEQFRRNLRQLKEEGFRIFVDDLGAGVTSVRDLWSYPVDVVKIDRSVLLETDSEQGSAAYRGLRNLAADLGYKVLCEGIETERQYRFVLDADCHYGQGFLFYRPMEEERFLFLMGGKK